MKEYILVSFPEIQKFQEHPRWNECIACQDVEGHPCPSETWVVPKDLYMEVFWGKVITVKNRRFKIIGLNRKSTKYLTEPLDFKGWTDPYDEGAIIMYKGKVNSYCYLDKQTVENAVHY